MPEASETSSVTSFRGRIFELLEVEAGAARRDIVILALDGIPFALADALWATARIARMDSVFPSTSSTAWLSSLTGLEVDEHGIPGVAFAVGGGSLINVYDYRGRLDPPMWRGNMFSDARDFGYLPLAIVGDLEPLRCSWRELLLRGSERRTGHRFFTAPAVEPISVAGRAAAAVKEVLASRSSPHPLLVWCFIDSDLHIHRSGYDVGVTSFLAAIEAIAAELADNGVVVVAHSDHGLVPTSTSPELETLLAETESGCEHELGGAGRTRWLYPAPGREDDVRAALEARLPPDIRLAAADDHFAIGSSARARVGALLLIAEGAQFLSQPGHAFDHGSMTQGELEVPFALWAR